MVGKDRRTGWKDCKRYGCGNGRYPRCEAYCQRKRRRSKEDAIKYDFFSNINIDCCDAYYILCEGIVRQAQAL